MEDFDPYDSLVPVYLNTDLPKRFQQIGTAVFLELYGEPFLLTAAHVTDEMVGGELQVPTASGFSSIEGYVGFIDLPPELHRHQDSVDIAYCRLSSRFTRELSHFFRPLPQERSELIKSALELTVCSASGYPASKSKKNGNAYSSDIFSFRGVVAQQQTYDDLELSPDQSIIIHFSKKLAVHPETMKAFPTPGLRGISGGGIFAWPKGKEISNDWSLPILVGIVHTFKEREGLIIGTTFLPVVAAIGVGRMKGYGGVR
jgi:hypothetical protein